MKRGIGFIRVSSEEQAAEGRAGILRQRQDIRTTAGRFDIEILDTIEVIDVSGTCVMQSPQVLTMLESLKRPETDCLVVSNLDRVFRPNDFTSYSIFDVFLQHRKLIFTPTGPINVEEIPGFTQVLIGGLVASIERRTMIDRIMKAKEELRQKGRHTEGNHTLPEGISFNRQTGEFSCEEYQAIRIQKAFNLILEGRNRRSVARELGYQCGMLLIRLTLTTLLGFSVCT